MKSKNFSFRKLFANNRFSVIFALVVAFIFWLVITIDQTEIITKSFANISINLSTEGSLAGENGWQIISIEDEKTATVTAHGPNSAVNALELSDIIIDADLSEVTKVGTYTLELSARSLGEHSGITFDISPKTVKVVIDKGETKENPEVIPVAKGITLKKDADTNLFVGDPVINSVNFSDFSISGAGVNIAKLSRIEAVVGETEAIGESKTYEADIVLYDEKGNVLDNSLFTISAEKLKVTVPVYRARTVSVVPVFTNEPSVDAGEAKLKNVSVNKIEVYGLPDTVDDLANIKLSPIDYREIEAGKTTFTVRIELPDGIYTKKEIGEVTVTFNVS